MKEYKGISFFERFPENWNSIFAQILHCSFVSMAAIQRKHLEPALTTETALHVGAACEK
jgi:hypothetical protein